MSDTAVDITSVPDADRSSPPPSPPPPYSNHEQELPPYPAAPPTYPPLQAESTSISQPGADYEPPANIDPEAASQTVSSPFDDKTVRRGFVRKVGTMTDFMLQRSAFSYFPESERETFPSELCRCSAS